MWVYNNGENTNHLYALITRGVSYLRITVDTPLIVLNYCETEDLPRSKQIGSFYRSHVRHWNRITETRIAEGEKGTLLLSLWTIKQTPIVNWRQATSVWLYQISGPFGNSKLRWKWMDRPDSSEGGPRNTFTQLTHVNTLQLVHVQRAEEERGRGSETPARQYNGCLET